VLKLQSRRLQLAKVAVDKRYRTGTTIQGFPAELTQVFLNLIENAIQAMPNGGRMRVTVSETDRWRKHSRAICASVCDTGSGITVEHGKRLFEPFFTTKSTKGTGLGLWISKGIIQKYDGEIRFRTIFRPSGDVTSFRVLIPLTETGTPS
jgi:signal transduction histidine kinase